MQTATPTRQQQAYDYRLRLHVHQSGDEEVARELGVPRSTSHGWRTGPCKNVVTHIQVDPVVERLTEEVSRLTRENRLLRAWLRIALMVWRIASFSFERLRLPEGKQKSRLLRAVDRASRAVPLNRILSFIGLSEARYYHWRNAVPCALTDRSSCPKTFPTQVSTQEVAVIHDLATSQDYRHVPTSTLARLAQRLGKVYSSASTWYRLMRLHKWRRPRIRVHPAKPKIGVRAAKLNEIWHVDMTLIRLLDGSKVYLHAVIDNFSRRILAWKTSAVFDASITAKILVEAASGLPPSTETQVMVDQGVENFNIPVDEFMEAHPILKRVLAQVEVTSSNSMIEAWWRVLKHNWLFLNTLDALASVTKLIEFYVDQHNTHLPHAAFKGQSPDEKFYGTGDNIPEQLQAQRLLARQARREANLAVSCSACRKEVALTLQNCQKVVKTTVQPNRLRTQK